MKLDMITNKKSKTDNTNPNDEHYTPVYAITPILQYLNPNSKIWCPFDTEESYYVKVLTKAGHTCIFSHIKDGVDFFTADIPEVNYIISNPPYSLKTEVLDRLFAIKIPFAMLLGVVGIFESQKRYTLFQNNTFEILYFNKRISYLKNYNDIKPALNPPFSSVYICSGILPQQICFAEIDKNNIHL